MAAGQAFSISVQQEDFDLGAELAALRQAIGAAAEAEAADMASTDIGALASFVGHVRGQAAAGTVTALELEHYPGMTEKALDGILARAAARWDLLGGRIIHRTGRLPAGAQIVLVVIASAHRGDAFAACEFVMDYLKIEAPFWKKEQTPSGSYWVDARASDDAAAARWEERR